MNTVTVKNATIRDGFPTIWADNAGEVASDLPDGTYLVLSEGEVEPVWWCANPEGQVATVTPVRARVSSPRNGRCPVCQWRERGCGYRGLI